MKLLIGLGVAFVAVWVVAGIFIGNYNHLVQTSASVDNAWAEVDTQYQRRLDLIPNLVASVKGAQGQELAVLTEIAEARKQYIGATSNDEKAQAANRIETNLALIPRLQEAYPELRSNDTLNRMMDELAGTENRILIARNRYNTQVNSYNVLVRQFPTNLFAGMYGYEPRTFFESQDGAETAPTVNFEK